MIESRESSNNPLQALYKKDVHASVAIDIEENDLPLGIFFWFV